MSATPANGGAAPAGFPRLLGDIGATNARFAVQLQGGTPPRALTVLPCSAHATLLDAMRSYLALNPGIAPRAGAIGIASAVTGDEVRMTNHPWQFSIEQTRAALGMERLIVMNDFAALALALPQLRTSERVQVGPGQARSGSARAVLGPGSGLGVGGLLEQRSALVPVVGEGGHVTLAATDEDEDTVLSRLRVRFGHVSAERALSGPGLVNLYVACCEVAGVAPQALPPDGVSSRALSGEDPMCRRAVELFFAFLGTTAGNLALTLGAWGGVYIGGGVVPHLLALMAASRFRARFEAKGRYAPMLREVPTWVIRSEFPPALLGAASALDSPA